MTVSPTNPAPSESTAEPRSATVNIAAHLSLMAQRYPHKRAVVCPASRDDFDRATYSHLTFRQLEQETDRYAHGLEQAGLGSQAMAVRRKIGAAR